MLAETARARTFGWVSLALWVCLGTGLELAHGFKLSAYLDDEMTRFMLTLAHAHGVGLALVSLAFSTHAPHIFDNNSKIARKIASMLMGGSVLLPLGFLLGAISHPEGDPGVGVLLAPLGALMVLVALVLTAIGAWRTSLRQPPRA